MDSVALKWNPFSSINCCCFIKLSRAFRVLKLSESWWLNRFEKYFLRIILKIKTFQTLAIFEIAIILIIIETHGTLNEPLIHYEAFSALASNCAKEAKKYHHTIQHTIQTYFFTKIRERSRRKRMEYKSGLISCSTKHTYILYVN